MQITMHPIVMYYRKDNSLVRDSLIFLSDDICHDYNAAECYDIVRAPSVVRVAHVHVWAAVAIFEA